MIPGCLLLDLLWKRTFLEALECHRRQTVAIWVSNDNLPQHSRGGFIESSVKSVLNTRSLCMGLDPSIEVHKSSQSDFSLRYCNSKIWFLVKNKKSPSQSQCRESFVVTIWSCKLCLNAHYQTLPFSPDVSCVVNSTSCTGFLRRRLRLLVVGPFVL